MKEKIFDTLFRLISTGQITKEEAFCLMKTLFENHSEEKTPFETDHKHYPGNDFGIYPWWNGDSIIATTTAGNTMTTTYSGTDSVDTYTYVKNTDIY